MNRKKPFIWTVTYSAAAALTLLGAPSAPAQSLEFDNTPVSNVVSKLAHVYGINVILGGGITPEQRVSFSVNNTDQAASGLEAVNNLANSLGADFQKVFVVSKVVANTDVTDVHIDTDGPVTFSSLTMPAQDALQTVAAVDSAVLKGIALTGNVTLSATSMSASQAAQEIAQQTHTRWKAYYAITPRGNQSVAAGGKVIDHTNGGQPIVQLPYSVYGHEPTQAEKAQQARAQADLLAAQQKQAAAQTSTNNPNAFMPYGANPYSPYAYPTGSYGGYGGYPSYGAAYGGYSPYGYNPNMPYGNTNATYFGSNGYGYDSSGTTTNIDSSVTSTAPQNTAVTFLPGSPFGYGAPIVLGGTNTTTVAP